MTPKNLSTARWRETGFFATVISKYFEKEISDMNPKTWMGIWLRPRAAMRALLDAPPQSGMIHLLAALSGMYQAYSRIMTRGVEPGNFASPLWMWIGIIVLGGFFGIVELYVVGWLLRLTGRWAGGQGTTESVRQAWAWSSVAVLPMLPFFVLEFYLYGDSLFLKQQELVSDTSAARILAVLVYLAELVLSIWSLIVFLKFLAEAHRFSTGKALLATVYAGLLIFAAFIVAFVVVILFAVLFR
jgi:hypothetical protein